MLRRLLLLCLTIMLLAGCAAPVDSTATPSITPKTEPSPIPATVTLTPKPARTRQPTLTPAPTETPTATPTPEPKFWAADKPCEQPLDAYLKRNNLFTPELSLSDRLILEDINGDFIPDAVFTTTDELGKSRTFLVVSCIDVNGDNQNDLVSNDSFYIQVFLWASTEYRRVYEEIGYAGNDLSESFVSFKDWTNDQIPEIVVDVEGDAGPISTGVRGLSVYRHLLQCRDFQCALIWRGALFERVDDYNSSGLSISHAEINPIMQGNTSTIRYLWEGFSIYCCNSNGDANENELKVLNIFSTTIQLYQWDGMEFKEFDNQIVSHSQVIPSDAILAATSKLGTQAIISATMWRAGDSWNGVCKLSVNGQQVKPFIGCKDNFVKVQWKDITNDGADELVVVALSGGLPVDVSKFDDWPTLSDIFCVHQHLLAYQWDGVTATLIADVEGCVQDETLYGVRLEDWENDGQIDIRAASTGELPERIYKWNGKQFVMWSEVP